MCRAWNALSNEVRRGSETCYWLAKFEVRKVDCLLAKFEVRKIARNLQALHKQMQTDEQMHYVHLLKPSFKAFTSGGRFSVDKLVLRKKGSARFKNRGGRTCLLVVATVAFSW